MQLSNLADYVLLNKGWVTSNLLPACLFLSIEHHVLAAMNECMIAQLTSSVGIGPC